jgi:hypothetical protein
VEGVCGLRIGEETLHPCAPEGWEGQIEVTYQGKKMMAEHYEALPVGK